MNTAEVQNTFNAHRPAIYGWAYRVLGNHHDALDVTQEVFVKWWRINREDTPPTRAVGWLRRVTINHSLNLSKARSKQTDIGAIDPPDTRTSPTDIATRELTGAVADALSDMSDQQRAVLFAKTYDGLTFARIAEEMNLAVPTVKTHYLRAVQTARRRLAAAGIVAGETL